MVVFQDRELLDLQFAGIPVLIRLRVQLPEYDHAALLTLAHLSACLLGLLVGQPLAGSAQHELIQQAVRPASRSAVSPISHASPRAFPRDDSLLQLRDDTVGYDLIDIHGTSSLFAQVVLMIVLAHAEADHGSLFPNLRCAVFGARIIAAVLDTPAVLD